jgi:exonuclease VII large subunit
LEARLATGNPIHRVRLARQQIDAAGRHLEALSYRNVLARGYSVTRDKAGDILRSVAQVSQGQPIRTELADGTIDSRVTAAQGPAPAKTRREQKPDHGPKLFD